MRYQPKPLQGVNRLKPNHAGKGQDPVDTEVLQKRCSWTTSVEKMLTSLHQLGQWALAQAAAERQHRPRNAWGQPPSQSGRWCGGEGGSCPWHKGLPPGRCSRGGTHAAQLQRRPSVRERASSLGPCCPNARTGFAGGSAGKESGCHKGDLGSIPGLGRSPGEGKGYPL